MWHVSARTCAQPSLKTGVPGVASARLARPSFLGTVRSSLAFRYEFSLVLANPCFFSDDDAAVAAVDEGTYLVIPEFVFRCADLSEATCTTMYAARKVPRGGLGS